MSQRQFKVIIIGGSVTGLTLAHSLHKIGIDYVVLEKRDTVTPQEGASIGILPNGARILDQLGLYEAIKDKAPPLGATSIHFPDEFVFTSLYPKKILENFGYPIAFLERRQLLRILYDALPDKTRIHVNKTMSTIEYFTKDEMTGARVLTQEGDVYEGDLIVGADGIHSQTRGEIWRRINSSKSAFETAACIDKCILIEYSCCFGISKCVTGLVSGEQVMHMSNGRTLVVIPSKDEVVFWFLVEKLDRKYTYSEAPRFTIDDATALCSQAFTLPIGNGMKFEDVWNKREIVNMLSLEESCLSTWSTGRLVCIGDSIHKMTVNLGQGANCAIEDVAVLSNLLRNMCQLKSGTRPTEQEIDLLLRKFNKEHLSRVTQITNMSKLTVRVHARKGLLHRFVGRYVMPYFGEYFEARPFNMLADAAALDFIPLPKSSYPGWEKYSSKTRGNSRLWPLMFTLPLLYFGLSWIVGIYWKAGYLHAGNS
ncbi:FAD-dependent monooxygenase [Metarhizium guizhouense ARSEF 977]|uniref:FAD-dependent monooxygenase n=1 Tax=Metarhizium guizhouense (strain ARSEF 977) TaxID=1276136 RepID=A0A0B4G7U1_METGA|nr:FAD-dependent monooxygenase [Metarhizium guizhouense ARSEF 977]